MASRWSIAARTGLALASLLLTLVLLEIGLRGRRRPKVAAYWDGCLMAMV